MYHKTHQQLFAEIYSTCCEDIFYFLQRYIPLSQRFILILLNKQTVEKSSIKNILILIKFVFLQCLSKNNEALLGFVSHN